MRVGQSRRRDSNEAEIVAALEAIGVTVLRLSGDGVPDLLTFRGGQWLPLEVKAPGGALTASQRQLQSRADFPVVETVEEALALFEVPICICGTDLAEARGLRAYVRADVVCPKHDGVYRIKMTTG